MDYRPDTIAQVQHARFILTNKISPLFFLFFFLFLVFPHVRIGTRIEMVTGTDSSGRPTMHAWVFVIGRTIRTANVIQGSTLNKLMIWWSVWSALSRWTMLEPFTKHNKWRRMSRSTGLLGRALFSKRSCSCTPPGRLSFLFRRIHANQNRFLLDWRRERVGQSVDRHGKTTVSTLGSISIRGVNGSVRFPFFEKLN